MQYPLCGLIETTLNNCSDRCSGSSIINVHVPRFHNVLAAASTLGSLFQAKRTSSPGGIDTERKASRVQLRTHWSL